MKTDAVTTGPSLASPRSVGLGTARFQSPRPRVGTFRWSRRLGSIAGIDVYVHVTFLVLLGLAAFGGLLAGEGLRATARALFLLLAVFGAVVLHELGHALVARRFGIRTRDITLLPIGGVASLEGMPEKPSRQLLVALAGPAVNLVLAALLFGLARALGAPIGATAMQEASAPFLAQLGWINLSLAAFNLLPGYPMDGGRVLRAVLAMRLAPERATQIAARVGQIVAVGIGLLGLALSPFLVVIAVFVWLGAGAERSLSEAKVALAGLSVRHGMITGFQTLLPNDSLSRAVDLTLSGFQQDFPVMRDDRPIGILTHAGLLAGLAERGPEHLVQDAMTTRLETTSPSDALDDALARMQLRDCRVLLVLEDERMVGLLTIANIGELLALRAAEQRPLERAAREGAP